MKKRKIGIIVLIALVLVAGGYKKMLVEIEQEAKNTTLLREATYELNRNMITVSMYPSKSCLDTMKQKGIVEHFKYNNFPADKYKFTVNVYDPNDGDYGKAAYTILYEKELAGTGEDTLNIKLD